MSLGQRFGNALLHALGIVGMALGGAQAAATADLQEIRDDVIRTNPNFPLPPALLAEAVLKGHTDQVTAADEARTSGLTADRFGLMVDTAGNAPGPAELLAMLRRGIIDEGAVGRGVRQGFLRNEWLPAILALKYSPISPADAVQAAVQNHMDRATAQRVAAEGGVNPDDFGVLYDNAGNPPGPVEAVTMGVRGFLSSDEVDQALRESRLKDKYIPALRKLAEYHVPPRTITTLLTHAAISEPVARDLLAKHGITGQVADAFIASAQHVKTASHKELAVGTVKSLFADGVLTRSQALDDLGKVGYAPPEANLILDLAGAQARQKVRNATVNKIRSIFVARKIDRATAENDLHKIGVDADQVGPLLDLWELEQTTVTRTLSLGQLNSAYKKGFIDLPTFMARTMALGYDQADATILADLDVPPATP